MFGQTDKKACSDGAVQSPIQGEVNLWWDTADLNFTSHTTQFHHTGPGCFGLVWGFLEISQASVFAPFFKKRNNTTSFDLNNLRFNKMLPYATMLIFTHKDWLYIYSTGVLSLLVGKENKPCQTGFHQVLWVVLKDFYQLEPKNGTCL